MGGFWAGFFVGFGVAIMIPIILVAIGLIRETLAANEGEKALKQRDLQ